MKAPTDLELMMYADGELPEPRASEVADFLASSEGASVSLGKLDGMAMVGDVVRDGAARLATLHDADGIAALVMKSIEGQGRTEGRALKLESSKKVSSEPERLASNTPISTEPKPANDNNRFIYALAGLAAAAAVVLGVWGRSAPAPEVSGREPVVRDLPTPALSSPLVLDAPATEARQDVSAHPAGLDHPEDAAVLDDSSVKVASVDFGSKTGTVYYVPKDTPGATTAVVWLADQ